VIILLRLKKGMKNKNKKIIQDKQDITRDKAKLEAFRKM
jgi:hypothetical protein